MPPTEITEAKRQARNRQTCISVGAKVFAICQQYIDEHGPIEVDAIYEISTAHKWVRIILTHVTDVNDPCSGITSSRMWDVQLLLDMGEDHKHVIELNMQKLLNDMVEHKRRGEPNK